MSSASAIVIGGGVIGLSTAYQLARKGMGKVILVEKGPVGDGASSRAAGIVTGLLWTETGVRARQLSLALFRELSDRLAGYTFGAVGCLNLFDAASWPEREQMLPLYDHCGAAYEILDAVEMRRRWPDLTPASGQIGLYDPLGGYSEPHDYIPALAAECCRLGVEIREHEAVEDFVLRDGRISGLRTSKELIETEVVVSTVHVWTLALLARLGLQTPIKAFVHQRYVTAPLAAPVSMPAINANPLGGYIRPAHGNRLLVGFETEDRLEYGVNGADFHMSQVAAPTGLREAIMERFPALVGALAGQPWESEHVGLLSFSMDGEPILGPVAAVPGLYVGVAFHSGGFAYNPAAGLLLAESIVDGQTQIDISAFSPNRFSSDAVTAHLATSLSKSHVVRRRH
jgi:sarcosine oxidase, subunit beta